MQLIELMELCTTLSNRVLDLENVKDAQALKIQKLKKRVKRLEKKRKSRTSQLKRRLFKVRIESSAENSLGDQKDASNQEWNDQDKEISLVQEDAETQGSAPVTTAGGVSVSTTEPSTPPLITTTLIKDEDLTIVQTLIKMRSVKSKEKSKEKRVSSTRLTRGVIMKEASETESRPIVPPQQQLDPKDKEKGITQEPEKPVKVKGKDQIALDEEVTQRLEAQMQAGFEEEERADYELAQRLQADEQGELPIAERSKLFVELMDKRKKHFAKLKAKEIKRKPPTQAQKRNQMCKYLKIWVLEGSRKKAESNGKEAVSKKRTEEEFDQESSKRQKTSESSELSKEPRYKEADELDDLVMLWSLVKEKFNSTEPTDDKERKIWLYDSCRVHNVSIEKGIDIYTLVENEYPLSKGTLTLMLVANLLVDQDNKMSRELLRKIFMQAERPRR
nr:hypothetical protein [Tanacetum cinerariifolium]